MSTSGIVQREHARLKTENEALKKELSNLQQFVKILNELANAARKVTTDAELMPLLRDILQKAMKLLDAPDGSLMLLDDETNELVFMIVYGTLSQDLMGYRIPGNAGIAGWVVNNAQPALVRDVRRDARFSHMIDENFKFQTQSIAAAPIIGDQKVYGLIEVLNKVGDDPFSDTEMGLLALLCRSAGEALADIEHSRQPV